MKQIIALGGGGFSMEPENELLDTYILKQSPARTPKICFIATASGDAESYIDRFYQFFKNKECIPSHLSLFKPNTRDIEGFLLEQDIIYVSGGNTKNLLILWKEWGVDQILEKALAKGVVLAGISAGSICWFDEGVTDSYGDGLEPLKALGFIKGSHCPHYDGELERRPAFTAFIASSKLSAGYAADDGAALHFIDGKLERVVSSRPHATAYFVEEIDGKAYERKLKTIYLGDHQAGGG
ncbi:Type 1 glutamine amidotransferase-like domain-containing protein [Bacillus sp. SCS-153A]|uniref:Type 1 glutamine amidotransferase-like domain-containing protein n=1 Tax=Rossellomorea sedimentorum TaxID=3115294 RepID=UPI003905E761